MPGVTTHSEPVSETTRTNSHKGIHICWSWGGLGHVRLYLITLLMAIVMNACGFYNCLCSISRIWEVTNDKHDWSSPDLLLAPDASPAGMPGVGSLNQTQTLRPVERSTPCLFNKYPPERTSRSLDCPSANQGALTNCNNMDNLTDIYFAFLAEIHINATSFYTEHFIIYR